ncbi:hypothetical protein CP533_6896 [Ophiocordyceps camponoti-saundersi (nom. inval.)]|nr:hypothetical protein CP533_6896 [Ophiocordyceps camponoti-saundersi (nom. inval.)]
MTSLTALRRFTLLSSARSFSTTAARDIARISIIGSLASDPVSDSTKSGRNLVKYTVASTIGSGDKKTTSLFRVTSFVDGPRRDTLLKMQKGYTVFVEGDASCHSYLDKDGRRQSSFGVVQQLGISNPPALESMSSNE